MPSPDARKSLADVDFTIPSVARMYDYALGGKDNYAADREAVAHLESMLPGTTQLCLTNRAFLRRAVRLLAEEYGVRQFLDHGSGLPTQDNVHQVAQRVDPEARVVYVDNDPIVLAHGRALLAENDRTHVVQADMRDLDGIYGHPEVTRLIDFSRPVGVLFVSVLHCLPDEDAAGLLPAVTARLAPGSFVVANQLVSENATIRREVTAFMVESTQGNWGRLRQPHEVERYFDGLEVLEPGLVEISRWRPDSDFPRRTAESDLHEAWVEFGGVARVP